MDKVTSLKKIAGSSATGDTVCEVLESMVGVVDTVNGNAEDIEELQESLAGVVGTVNANAEEIDALQAKFPTPKEIVLESSTEESTKKFKITVVDGGTISATEIVENVEP